MRHSLLRWGGANFVFTPVIVGGLLAGAVIGGCSGNVNSDPSAQTGGGAGTGGKHGGSGGDSTPKGGAASAGASSGSGGAHAGGGTPGAGGRASGGASPLGGASGIGGSSGTSNGGSSTTGGKGGSAGANTGGARALGEAAAAFCSAARSCCPSGSPLTDCEGQSQMRYPIASIQSGAVRVDPTAFDACVAAYQKAANNCQEIPVVAACRNVFVGTRRVGESCTDTGYDCSTEQGASTCLVTTQNGHTGVCTSNPRGHSGDPCAYSCRDGDTCGGTTYGSADAVFTLCFESDGLYCDYPDSGVATCKPIEKIGDPCTLNDQCGTKAYCDSTCKRISMEGESCGTCRHDLTCISGTCQSPSFQQTNACDGYSLGP